MSEYFPIQIRHLDKTIDPLSGSDLFPIQIGNAINGFETRASNLSDVLSYINYENLNTDVNTLNVSNSAQVSNLLYVGNVNPIQGINFYVDGNAVISGSLSALSGVTYFKTNIAQTTAMLLSGASGVGLTVLHDYEFPIAQFFDSTNIALHIDGASERAGNVGVKTIKPNEALTVYGNISASNVVYGLHANTRTAYVSSLSTYNSNVRGSAVLGTEVGSSLTIGNLSSSQTTINGNVNINAVSSSAEFKTIIGSESSDVYINGYAFIKNLSSTGDLFLNNINGQSFEVNLGNFNAINNVLGTTTLSGDVYLNGDVNINSEGNNNTYLNNIDNTGSVFVGNPFNTLNVNTNKLTHNSNLTSELVNLTFTEIDSLTSTIDTIFNDLSIVYFVSSINPLNQSITSVQYKYVENIEGLSIDLTQDILNIGSEKFSTNIKGNTITSTAGSLLSLYTLSGGIVKIGEENNNIELKGFSVEINDPSDGVEKSTYINSKDGAGNIELGNTQGYTIINGLSTYVNTLCAANTVIGHLSGTVEVYNLTVLNSFSAIIDNFEVNNLAAQNVLVSENANFNNVNVGGLINTTNGNSDQWNISYDEIIRNDGTGLVLSNVTNYLSTSNVQLSSATLNSATVNNTLSVGAVQVRTVGYNVFLGDSTTGRSTTTGNHNFVFGLYAGYCNTTGGSNNFLGSYAGYYNTTGNSNNFIGRCAGFYNQTGSNNNFIGRSAGFCGRSEGVGYGVGTNNNFFGQCAGFKGGNGTNNNFFGQCAGFNVGNYGGSNNTFIGYKAGKGQYIGTHNYVCANNMISYNVAIGFKAGYKISGGLSYWGADPLNSQISLYKGAATQNNIFVGYKAGYNSCAQIPDAAFISTVGDNNFLGFCAGFSNTLGSCNNFFGRSAGSFNRTGSNNIFIGNNANTASAQMSALNGVIVLGTGAIATQTNQIVLSTANISIRSLSGTAVGPNLFIGNATTGNNTATGSHNFVFGLSAGNALTSGNNNVFIGNCAGRVNTTGGSNNFFGSNAGRGNTTGGSNNFFGSNAGRCNTDGDWNNFLGPNAGFYNNTGCSNNFLGFNAGNANTEGSFNNFFGDQAGLRNTTGGNNNFFSRDAGVWNTTGGNNNFFGYKAGCSNTTGSCNNFLGNCAGGFNRTGSNNIFIGNNANTASAQTSALSGVIVLGTGATAQLNNELSIGSTTWPLSTRSDNTFTGQVSSVILRLNGSLFRVPIIPV